VALVLVCGFVAKEFQGVAPFHQRQPLGDEALQFDRADFGAVLFALAELLGGFVVVESALHAIDGAVKEIDRRPEQTFEVGFKAGVGQRHHEGIKDIGDAACEDMRFGKRPRIGFILKRTVAIELEFAENLVRRG